MLYNSIIFVMIDNLIDKNYVKSILTPIVLECLFTGITYLYYVNKIN